MKNIYILLLLMCNVTLFAQEPSETSVKTKVNEVTVFLKGAQILRHKSVDIKSGVSVFKFTGLSPFIDAKSIQVKASGNIKVQSVNHQLNYLDKNKKSPELLQAEAKLKQVKDKITLENTYLDIINQDIDFLKSNRNFGGRNQQISLVSLKQMLVFYNTKFTKLKLGAIKRNETLFELRKQKSDIENQIEVIAGKKDYPTGQILVKLSSKKPEKATLMLSYLVKNAGWFPSYDVRAKTITQPLELVYKANVFQDTKVDWSDVKLKFSSSEPSVSGVAPQLKPYYLDYNSRPPSYEEVVNHVSGIVSDSDGPLPGVNVVVKGTTIGTTTDFDGLYDITLPNNSSDLEFSFVGMNTKVVRANSSQINVILESSSEQLNEVVVTAYGRKRNSVGSVLRGKVAGVRIRGASSINNDKKIKLANQVNKVSKQTAVEFVMKTPFTIKSSAKSYAVDMKGYSINAYYQYYSVPKIDDKAFLLAHITNWEQYNLLDGEVNIFFEGAFVGKSLLNLSEALDTLKLSLGQDKQVAVKREKLKNFTTKQFFGSKKEETKAWKITVKNNKSQAINMVVYDQVPVSTLEDIKVELQESSNARFNDKIGELKWEFTLEPDKTKTFVLKYAVKYPKNRDLIIE